MKTFRRDDVTTETFVNHQQKSRTAIVVRRSWVRSPGGSVWVNTPGIPPAVLKHARDLFKIILCNEVVNKV